VLEALAALAMVVTTLVTTSVTVNMAAVFQIQSCRAGLIWAAFNLWACS
jgi:hypothetical protein